MIRESWKMFCYCYRCQAKNYFYVTKNEIDLECKCNAPWTVILTDSQYIFLLYLHRYYPDLLDSASIEDVLPSRFPFHKK